MQKHKTEIEALTGLRFIAALWVFLYHIGFFFFKPYIPEIWPIYKVLFNGGGFGVDLFFILSGFVIAYNYFHSFENESQNHLSFLYKRFARIYPVHLFTLALLLPVSFFFSGDWFLFGSLERFIGHLFLLQSLSIPVVPVQWNPVSWSISSEWFAYCVFPVYVLIFKRNLSFPMLLFCMLMIYIMSCMLVFFLIAHEVPFTNPAFWLLRIFSEFGLGILLYKLWLLKPQVCVNQFLKRWIFPLLTLLILLSSHKQISFVWVIPALVAIIYLTSIGQFFNNFLSQSWIKYSGRLSYSLYMVHGTVMVIFLKSPYFSNVINSSIEIRSIFVAAYVVTTIILVFFCYHFIEEPFRKALLARNIRSS